MSEIRAVIADDEEQLRIYLKARLLEVWPDLVLCGEARNGPEALELIEKLRPDVAFLDIRMPGLSGMEVARRITETCRVVFITAYDQHAVEAFEQEAIDYLLKPVTPERLKKTVQRLKKGLAEPLTPSMNLPKMMERVLKDIRKNGPHTLRWIKVQEQDSMKLVPVDEVYFFQSRHKYTEVATREGEHLIRKPIHELEAELDPDMFWRIHRGTIVNASYIDKVSSSSTGRGVLKLRGRTEFHTVSRSYAHIFKKM
jgi:DNA-binding LytR/AlgR family response regulator